ncbi:MAG: AgmX/PglI C-terminal domain-containing protein [Bdellovibrionia bacterium]
MKLLILMVAIQFTVLVALADLLIPPRKPHVKSGGGKVEFSENIKDHDAIIRFVETKLGELNKCYDAALKKQAQVDGEYVVKFDIASNGKSKTVGYEGEKTRNWDFSNCLLKRFKSWKFPKTADGKPGSVIYSFEFLQKEEAPPES